MGDLDKAWEAVNELGGTADPRKPYEVGYCAAIGLALEAIEALGGRDPAMPDPDCTCGLSRIHPDDVDPPHQVLNPNCPVHGRDPDRMREERDDA